MNELGLQREHTLFTPRGHAFSGVARRLLSHTTLRGHLSCVFHAADSMVHNSISVGSPSLQHYHLLCSEPTLVRADLSHVRNALFSEYRYTKTNLDLTGASRGLEILATLFAVCSKR